MKRRLSALVLAPMALLLAQLAFDSASVKLDRSGSTSSRWDTHVGSITVENKTLQSMVAIAYGVDEDQVTGGPGWVSSDCFDINARAGSAAKYPELLLMLQTLLAQRFHLVVHTVKVNTPGYSLTVCTGGIKLHADESEARSMGNTNTGKIEAQRMSTGELAKALKRILGVPVIDSTGITDRYTFKLDWTGDPTDALPALLESKLGLKLENRKLTLDSVVIDKAEKPTEN